MANTKISALSSLAGSAVDTAADVLAIVDTGSTETKKILVDELAIAMRATQAEQEAATSASTTVSPSVQHYHPSAAKCWGRVSVSGGTPTLQESFNVTSITDAGVGLTTVTIATDFSSAGYVVMATVLRASAGAVGMQVVSQAAGSFQVRAILTSDGTATDSYDGFYFVCFGTSS